MDMDHIWLYIILTTVGVALLRIGITGQVRSVGRGSAVGVFAHVKSVPLRTFLSLLGLAALVWLFVAISKGFRH